jgi:hypothetical protein
MFDLTKRKRFIITSAFLSLGFFGIQFLDNIYRFPAIAALSILTLILFYWSLKEGLGKNQTLLALILPFMFTVGVGLFWFLLPASIFTRLPVVVFYGLGIYALCLTMNIYTVSAIRTIALLRAARGVGFVLTLVTSFLVYDTILSLRSSLLINTLLISFSSLPLFLQGFWAIPLETEFSWKMLRMAGVASLVMAQVAVSIYFWPVTVVVGSLFLTVAVYVLLGLGQARLEARLFVQTVREYLLVGLLVFVGMLIATSWGG